MTEAGSTQERTTGSGSGGTAIRAIDIVCNLYTPELVADRPSWTGSFFGGKLGQPDSLVGGVDLPRLVDMLDEAGIERAFLIATKAGPAWDPESSRTPYRAVIDAVRRYPDRFVAIAGIDPTEGMDGVRELRHLVEEHGFRGAHLYPHWFDLAPDEARYYPFYAKCCELDVPIQMQVGHCLKYTPARRLRSVGHPMTLDTVANDFPELKLIGIHTGWPWTEEMISVAWKHPNVYIGTDAYAPRYLPGALVHFLNSWGREKVMFGTDFPVIDFARARREIDALDLREDARRLFLRDNAARVYRLDR